MHDAMESWFARLTDPDAAATAPVLTPATLDERRASREASDGRIGATADAVTAAGVALELDPMARIETANRAVLVEWMAVCERRFETQQVAADLAQPSRPYRASEGFQLGERLWHPTFGEGVVEARPEPGKMTVFFLSGRKVLAQARIRRSQTCARPAAAPPRFRVTMRGTMAAALLPVTADDRAAFERRNDELMIVRLQQGLYVGMLVGVVLCPPTRLAYPDLAWGYVLMPAFATIVMIVTSILARLDRFRHSSAVLSSGASWTVGTLAAIVATETGGFASPYFYIHILIYCFATAFFPASPRLLAIACFPNGVIACVVIAIGTPEPGSMILPGLFSVAAALYSYIGTVVRARGDLQSFVAHARLAETKASLAALNDQLEARVETQVHEIVRRAHDIDALNAQLREKVQERSRELARALRTISEERPRSTLRPGDVLGDRAVIGRLLGAGGMGTVYLATDRLSGRAVAVKVLTSSAAATPTELRRFLVEAEAATAVADPAIVKTLHVDVSHEGVPFHIMEYVDGVSLARLIDAVGRVEAPLVAAIGAAIARALAAAHAAGVVHRDIKPSNVMIAHGEPAIRVLDFGLSKIHRVDDERSAALTATGTVVGTPAYMSPEQASGVPADAPSDVYSLGVVLYELAAGQHPFPGEGRIGLMVAHTTRTPPALAGVEPTLASLIHAAMAKDPAARPSAATLAERLARLAAGDPRGLLPRASATAPDGSDEFSMGALATLA